MKKYVILIILFIAISIMGFIIGLYIFKTENMQNEVNIAENIVTNKQNKENTNNIITTGSQEEKISVNTKIYQRVYYTDCKHLIETQIKDNKKYINKTKAEMQIEFIDWTIQKFTSNEVVLYKEIYNFCNEHYLACDEFGYIVIYQLDKNDVKKEKVMSTGIATEFLAEEDAEKLKAGIKIYSKKELNEFLEDFE